MIGLAKILCEGFHYVRIDFYILNDGRIKFGEMTFYPYSGRGKWEPPEYDFLIGQKINLPTSSQ